MKKKGQNKKNGIRKLSSEQDYLRAFLNSQKKNSGKDLNRNASQKNLNRHGLPFVEDYETQFTDPQDFCEDPAHPPTSREREEEEDFSLLLAQSLNEQPPPRKTPAPVPLKKRLKRYPGPEADLDLHGFTAIGAQVRTKTFLQTALHQGYFTVRIIVGKGLHSPEGPVLPVVVEDLVKTLKTEKSVLSYEWEGGRRRQSGALIVYLNQFND